MAVHRGGCDPPRMANARTSRHNDEGSTKLAAIHEAYAAAAAGVGTFTWGGRAGAGAPDPSLSAAQAQSSRRRASKRTHYQTVLETLNMETCPSKGRVDSGRFEETSTFGPASAQCYVTVDGLPRARLTSNL
ncbi:hypothetical protein MSG28_013204 [Choristoneura fumiferana]|uniref:Uncharacterized protein n=1 Tax=Choristoneura fumiferana TaxID=7141 RepID=A0ACC0KTA1_CHOFU|nr:hypothetical protein MSG28_013204 [Choristoneura fumiferana]